MIFLPFVVRLKWWCIDIVHQKWRKISRYSFPNRLYLRAFSIFTSGKQSVEEGGDAQREDQLRYEPADPLFQSVAPVQLVEYGVVVSVVHCFEVMMSVHVEASDA